MERRPLSPEQLAPAGAVLQFFRARMHVPPILLDRSLAEDGLCLRDSILLHPRAALGPELPSALAHELFHFWSRSALKHARWGQLPREVPRFAAERSAAHGALAAANVEEIATDLLAERLCASAGLAFHPAYLAELPGDLIQTRLRDAVAALSAAGPRPAGLASREASQHELETLATAREALRRLSGFELSALALHELRRGASICVDDWPRQLAIARPLELEALATGLDALEGPRVLALVCQVFSRPEAGVARSPLWTGTSPLDPNVRGLGRRLRDPEGSEELWQFLTEVAAALGRIDPKLSSPNGKPEAHNPGSG